MKINIDNGKLKIKLSVLEKFASIRGSFEIPLEHIEKATTETPQSSWGDMRTLGTNFPSLVRAGTYRTKRGKEFWYVTKNKNYLVIELKDESYKRIILSSSDNHYWAEMINKSVK